MKQDNKNSQITMRMTDEQKAFIIKKSKEEGRSITSIVNLALGSRYPAYKKILMDNKGE